MLGTGIEARIYFPPTHRQEVFADAPTELPVTQLLAGRILSLPMHSSLSPSDLARIADELERLVGNGMSDA